MANIYFFLQLLARNPRLLLSSHHSHLLHYIFAPLNPDIFFFCIPPAPPTTLLLMQMFPLHGFENQRSEKKAETIELMVPHSPPTQLIRPALKNQNKKLRRRREMTVTSKMLFREPSLSYLDGCMQDINSFCQAQVIHLSVQY